MKASLIFAYSLTEVSITRPYFLFSLWNEEMPLLCHDDGHARAELG